LERKRKVNSKSPLDLSLKNQKGTEDKVDKFIFNSMKKDKIYELRIDEDDEISGIDSISLVDEPAIEVSWVAFNKHKHSATEECFNIPDGEDMKFSSMIIAKGQSEEELFNDGWEMSRQDFVSSSPNSPSFEDTPERLIRYKYVLNPQAPGAPIKETTRDFCRDLLNKNFVYRVEDLDNITNDLGSSALVWRGSFNCRHKWMRIEYRRGTQIVNKGSITKGRIDGTESYDVIGYPQPDTRTSNPSFSKENYEVGVPHYTEDGKLYEGPTHKDASGRLMTGAVHTEDSVYLYHQDELDKVIIICKKCEHSWDIKDGGEEPYMCNKCDYDNTSEYKMGYDVDGLPSYVDQVSGTTIEKSLAFESYSDYPESAKNAAKRALDWVEKNGWGSCGTPVGKARANQLAKGEAISEETIARMASFARHAQNKDVPYSEGCGGLMWDAWGGTSGIEWAQNKLESIRNDMSKQKFQTDDDKRIVIGPAMVPDLKIFRKDMFGSPYYVFFSAETIKLIAEKYMRNKYTDNNDENHNGKAVEDVYVIESWIKEDKEDKSNKYGYSDLPVGTWFVSMKVRNDEVWKKVKNGELKGFSVSGFFEEIADFAKEHMFLQEVAKILSQIK